MRDVGEEILSDPACLLHDPHACVLQPLNVKQQSYDDRGDDGNYDHSPQTEQAAVLLLLQFRLCPLQYCALSSALYGNAYVVDAVVLVLIHDAVLQGYRPLMPRQGIAVVTLAALHLVVQSAHLALMLPGSKVSHLLVRHAEPRFRLRQGAGVQSELHEREYRLQSVPTILGIPAEVVCRHIFLPRLVIFPGFLVEVTEIRVAERHPERIAVPLVHHHRHLVISSRLLVIATCGVYGAYVGIVDGLPRCASQFPLSFQSLTECAVGTVIILYGKIDISESVERHHLILPHRPGSVG